MSDRDALADLAASVGAALIAYSEALRTPSDVAKTDESETIATAPRGRRQREVLALDGIDSPDGLTALDVAHGAGVSQSNAYKLLTAMVDGGWLERVPDIEPAHWRSVVSDRRDSTRPAVSRSSRRTAR